MGKMISMKINQKDLGRVKDAFKKLGDGVIPTMVKVMDYAAAQVAKAAKANHFFVGTGKGAEAAAQENVFTFKNPDGTPRFKVRTANLINSIHEVPSVVVGKVVKAGVVAEMAYARKIEEGGPGNRAFPYMRPAVEQVKPQVVRVMRDEIKKLLDSVKKK